METEKYYRFLPALKLKLSAHSDEEALADGRKVKDPLNGYESDV